MPCRILVAHGAPGRTARRGPLRWTALGKPSSSCNALFYWGSSESQGVVRMPEYYVNKQAQKNGDHEVHKGGCSHMPSPQNKKYLGVFSSCHAAVREAKKYYRQSNGCYYCSNACHTG